MAGEHLGINSAAFIGPRTAVRRCHRRDEREIHISLLPRFQLAEKRHFPRIMITIEKVNPVRQALLCRVRKNTEKGGDAYAAYQKYGGVRAISIPGEKALRGGPPCVSPPGHHLA